MNIDRTRKAPRRPRHPARMAGGPLVAPEDTKEAQGAGTGDAESPGEAQTPPEPTEAPEKPTKKAAAKPRRAPARKKVEDDPA